MQNVVLQLLMSLLLGRMSFQDTLAGPDPSTGSGRSADAALETSAGWSKSPANPVLGGNLGTCFDLSLLKEGAKYRMWFSWRQRKSLAVAESQDGIHWSSPRLVLEPNLSSGWEDDINRPSVIRRADGYHLWYTGQARGHSWIGYATSPDGNSWTRSSKPVLSPDRPWENVAVMCPHVLFDQVQSIYRMWYSGGEQSEPNAIGHATSQDGLVWVKNADNPVFRPAPGTSWEKDRVTACQVLRQDDWFLIFYIGFRDEQHAQIGIARSRDGLTHWQRHPANPIIRPSPGRWDQDAVYKPFALRETTRWLLWYNGRNGSSEQIGLAVHEGNDLGFPAP